MNGMSAAPGRSVEHAAAPSKKPSPQLSGLGLIEDVYFETDAKTAQSQFLNALGPQQSLEEVVLSDNGAPSIGTSISDEDQIQYQNFSPPPAWNVQYSIQRSRIGAHEKQDFIFHNGEQLLVPIQGEVACHFYWSPGARHPERILLDPAAGKNTILRINPQIPHHFWGSQGEAQAWLILRHASDSPVALVADASGAVMTQRQRLKNPLWSKRRQTVADSPLQRRRVTLKELQKPGAYALIAWGISEFIRLARQKNGLTATDLAVYIGVDPSSLSRLEEAKTNVSIEMLNKVCRGLRIGIAECMESGSWLYELAKFDLGRSSRANHIFSTTYPTHRLHPHLLHLSEGEKRSESTGEGPDPHQVCSWIVAKGKLLLECSKALGGKSVIAEPGNVIHFRSPGQVQAEALKETTVIKIVYSNVCSCKPVK